ncbi:MAG: hypothetical protein E6K41_00805, partial [Gammaproteobacteria bacterium]
MFTFHFPAARVAPDAGRRCGRAAPHLTPVAGALLLFCCGWPDTGQAAPNDVAALRTELEALKADYSARVQALEARIRELESNLAARNAPAAGASAASLAAPTPAPAAPYAAAPARSSNLTAFNPAVSVILTGNYASLTQDPATYRIAGFIPPPTGEGPGNRSFNLDESELTFTSNVDPY